MPRHKLDLGREAEDIITGFRGIVVSKTTFLTGCDRYEVQPKIDESGEIPESKAFDEEQLKVVGKGIKLPLDDPGGPRLITRKKIGAGKK